MSCFVAISELNANSVDPDQTPSDLGLQCLPMSLLWEARLKWVKDSDQIARLSESMFSDVTAYRNDSKYFDRQTRYKSDLAEYGFMSGCTLFCYSSGKISKMDISILGQVKSNEIRCLNIQK